MYRGRAGERRRGATDHPHLQCPCSAGRSRTCLRGIHAIDEQGVLRDQALNEATADPEPPGGQHVDTLPGLRRVYSEVGSLTSVDDEALTHAGAESGWPCKCDCPPARLLAYRRTVASCSPQPATAPPALLRLPPRARRQEVLERAGPSRPAPWMAPPRAPRPQGLRSRVHSLLAESPLLAAHPSPALVPGPRGRRPRAPRACRAHPLIPAPGPYPRRPSPLP